MWAQLVLRENDVRKNTLVGRICVLSDRNKCFNEQFTSFSKNCVTSEGAVSHNALYYQQLSNAHY